MSEALDRARAAHEAAAALGRTTDSQRTAAVVAAADAIQAATPAILEANARDVERGRAAGLPEPLIDRLLLTEERLRDIAASMREVAALPDPLGRVVEGRTLASGVRMERLTVPLGVVAMIYEARPNVTADAIALTLRSGNAVVLRGGTAAHDSCVAIADAAREGVAKAGLDPETIQLITSEDRAETVELMHATGLVDVLIPRGGASLIQTCVRESKVPVIETGVGNCHVYLERTADVAMARDIVINAKTQRPGVCNAAESLLVDACAADELLPDVLVALHEAGVELVGDEACRAVAQRAGVPMGEATAEDWGTEYLDLKMSVHAVDDVDEAIAHINRYGTGHSECIVTSDLAASERFLAGVNAAAVYANASTRFTDGGVFGLGCEIGISTQKLHVRGPMGIDALTSTKYVLRGDGQVR